MPVPTAITDLSQTASSNFPSGSDSPANLDDTQRAHASFIALLRDGKGFTSPVTLASGATTDIGAQNTFAVEISGTTTITSFGTTYYGPRFLRFTGALTLTHSSTLNLPTAANITTAAGDTCIAYPNQALSGWNVIAYQKASGAAIVSSTDYLNTTRSNVASASTLDLTANAPNTRNIAITGTNAITAVTVAAGQTYFVKFTGALTLTNNANIVTQTGANITTAAGDTCILRATAANTVEVLCYVVASPVATTYYVGNGTKATLSADVTGIASNTASTISWTAEEFDDLGWHSTVSNQSRITVNATARYRITFCLSYEWDTGGTYTALARPKANLLKNGSSLRDWRGTTYYAPSSAWMDSGNVTRISMQGVDEFDLTSGDYLELQSLAIFGGSMKVLQADSFFLVERVKG